MSAGTSEEKARAEADRTRLADGIARVLWSSGEGEVVPDEWPDHVEPEKRDFWHCYAEDIVDALPRLLADRPVEDGERVLYAEGVEAERDTLRAQRDALREALALARRYIKGELIESAVVMPEDGGTADHKTSLGMALDAALAASSPNRTEGGK